MVSRFHWMPPRRFISRKLRFSPRPHYLVGDPLGDFQGTYGCLGMKKVGVR